ncbi:SGNH hydrolase-type esterase domain-containing protein [Polychytrium aggregatum]|uniref:SGNH hydrolase-type esterase domain-containing protein n=1 Tax=Polychytrium aggregatum TaxID=110093 RepID=UPI0022FE56AB|nr:SGNH hydrolase-type esterase domain-containing protein [Polychytrium aggregatum]KAI9199456.1 SGNH hydrolase-type esterase domain-containing protein [Polychytrium aggregatum]
MPHGCLRNSKPVLMVLVLALGFAAAKPALARSISSAHRNPALAVQDLSGHESGPTLGDTIAGQHSIEDCNALDPRPAPPSSVHDLRPDDIRVVAALGDSITAGFGAKGRTSKSPISLKTIYENRGVSFFIGGDPDAKTVSRFIQHYRPSLVGYSHGDHLAELCYGPLCPPYQYHRPNDELNAAQSGAMVMNLHQELDHLIQEMEHNDDIDMDHDFKLLNIFIGSNDACFGCDLASETTWLSPAVYEEHMRALLGKIRRKIPRTIVNIVQQFNISQVWDLTHGNDYCNQLRDEGRTFECKCAFLPLELGQVTRKRMDSLVQSYNRRLLTIWEDYQAEVPDEGFALVLDPGFTQIRLREWPIEMLSNVDCFHPSVAAHELMAATVWNNLYRNFASKQRHADPSVPMPIFCPENESRIQTR